MGKVPLRVAGREASWSGTIPTTLLQTSFDEVRLRPSVYSSQRKDRLSKCRVMDAEIQVKEKASLGLLPAPRFPVQDQQQKPHPSTRWVGSLASGADVCCADGETRAIKPLHWIWPCGWHVLEETIHLSVLNSKNQMVPRVFLLRIKVSALVSEDPYSWAPHLPAEELQATS